MLVHRVFCLLFVLFFFYKQKTAYEMRISDWSSDVCSSDLIEQLRTTDINSVAVRAAIEKIRPDVIVCQGTTLVRDATIAGVPFPLNIHAGLSPRYRGSRCTEWAVACGDVLNIGVTVHRLTKDIDGGAILGQARVQVRPEDTRSEEHTSELQSLMRISYAVFCLKKKNKPPPINTTPHTKPTTHYSLPTHTPALTLHN